MILGIDYGLRNIGLATSEGHIASPAATVKVKDTTQALRAIAQLVTKWNVDTIIIGISEGKSKDRAQAFGAKLKTMLRLNVVFIDETLSTHEASLNAKSDKTKEHARAAAVILQRYLDNKT